MTRSQVAVGMTLVSAAWRRYGSFRRLGVSLVGRRAPLGRPLPFHTASRFSTNEASRIGRGPLSIRKQFDIRSEPSEPLPPARVDWACTSKASFVRATLDRPFEACRYCCENVP